MTIVTIGAGKMATAIASGLVHSGILNPTEIIGVDPAAEARAAFEDTVGARTVAEFANAPADAGIAILAVKPQVAPQVVEPLAADCADKLVISIAAGIRLDTLCAWFGHRRVVRVMPNTPMTVGQGVAAFACAEGVDASDRASVRKIFDPVALVREVPEESMDAVTALSGSGPAYVFEFIQALIDGGTALGLDGEAARDLAVQTVAGATAMVAQRVGLPDELRAAVTSKGGTTAEGVRVLADNDFRSLVADAMRAARDRSVELGRG